MAPPERLLASLSGNGVVVVSESGVVVTDEFREALAETTEAVRGTDDAELADAVRGHADGPVVDAVVHHAAAVIGAVEDTLGVADLPFGSYDAGPTDAVRSATRLKKEGGADARVL